MLLRVILIMSLFTASCSTMQNKSGDWRLYHETEYYSYSYDADSIAVTENNTLRLRLSLTGRFSRIISETEIDCQRKTTRIISHTIFDAEMRILNTMAYDIIVWDNIVPGSSGESLFRAVCLNQNWVMSVDHARRVIEEWRVEYNQGRPHRSLGNLTPNEFRLEQENMLAFSNS